MVWTVKRGLMFVRTEQTILRKEISLRNVGGSHSDVDEECFAINLWWGVV